MTTKKYELDFGGKKLVAEFSDLADQTNGSVLVRYGETAVFATAVMSKRAKEGTDYLPLTVDYEERFYAAGQILGGRFMKREGKPSDEAVLTGRIVDRTIRPLFNQKIRNDIQVVVTALSVDGKNDTDIPAVIAGSLALGVSDIPWDGPVGAVRIAYQKEIVSPLGDTISKLIVNPTHEERLTCTLENVVCGKDDKINMIETSSKEISEEIVLDSFKMAVEEIKKVQEFQNKIIKEVGKKKAEFTFKEMPAEMPGLFKDNILEKLNVVLYPKVQDGKKADIDGLKNEWLTLAEEKFGEENIQLADDHFEDITNDIIHDKIINTPEGKELRPDGRKVDEIRPLHASVGLLPILHGSGVFYRGGTHVLSIVTLGGPKDAQLIEGMEVQTEKHFMHHYNFPPFSTGETGRMGTPKRREIGHGALAEKALAAIIPSREEFPYTIRIVSESMASNGSTSQGSICASTLALMDAGVPIKNPVAGIAMGIMVKYSQDLGHKTQDYKILTDIQGPEDHYGDMDFKCAGSKDGIVAIQMDVKVDGVTVEILGKALTQAKKARLEILDVITKAIPAPRAELSQYAPRIVKIKINPSKIGEVIGPGGKVINGLIEKYNVEIDVEQDGTVLIMGKSLKDTDAAREEVEGIVKEYQPGELLTGPVTRLFEFGAMVRVGPSAEGLVHISELAPFRVNKVTDIVKEGDVVTVKVLELDEKGRLNLSLKQANPDYKPSAENGGGYKGRR